MFDPTLGESQLLGPSDGGMDKAGKKKKKKKKQGPGGGAGGKVPAFPALA